VQTRAELQAGDAVSEQVAPRQDEYRHIAAADVDAIAQQTMIIDQQYPPRSSSSRKE
jgi:hypothetical protein